MTTKDAIQIGFISGLGVTLIYLSVYFVNHNHKIFQQRADIGNKLIVKAQLTCGSGKVKQIVSTKDYFAVTCDKAN